MRSDRETPKQQRLAKREARKQREEAARRRQRRLLWLWGGGGGVAVLAVIVAIVFASRANAAPTIDGIQCNTTEHLAYHIHQHLAIYGKGTPVTIPAYIGIDTTRGCLFWLHTHTPDGVIHVESPTQHTYTLGQFFDIWGHPLSRTQLISFKANRTHSIRAYVNGRLYQGDPRVIHLTQHELITLEYGPPWVPAPSFTFPAGT